MEKDTQQERQWAQFAAAKPITRNGYPRPESTPQAGVDDAFVLDLNEPIHCQQCRKPVKRLKVLSMGGYEWTVSALCSNCQAQREKVLAEAGERQDRERAERIADLQEANDAMTRTGTEESA